MCGIFGIVCYSKDPLFLPEIGGVKRLITNLLTASESRGRDASGICVITRTNKMLVLKDHVPGRKLPSVAAYSKIMDLMTYTTNFRCMIGHTRAKTQGSEKYNINNHPIIAGKVVGIHNGIISNDDQLFKLHKDEFSRDGEVDSEIIFKLINHHMYNNSTIMEATKKAAKVLVGSFSCAFIHVDHPNYMMLFTSGSPAITIHDYKDQECMVFASSERVLKEATKNPALSMFKNPSSKLEVGAFNGVRINTENGKLYTFELDVNSRHFNSPIYYI